MQSAQGRRDRLAGARLQAVQCADSALANAIPISNAAIGILVRFGEECRVLGAERATNVANDLVPSVDRALAAGAERLQVRVAGRSDQNSVHPTLASCVTCRSLPANRVRLQVSVSTA